MRILVVYYSYSGFTRRVAEAVARACSGELCALEQPKRRGTFMNFVMGGFEAMRRRSVALKPLACDVAAYDLVVLGTPVYAGTLPAPMRTFILQEGSRIRRATGFITASGREAENLKVLQEMRGLLPDIWREPGLFVCYSPNPNEVALGVSKAWGLELARATL